MFDRLRFLFSIALVIVPLFALVRTFGKDKEKATSTSTVVEVAETQAVEDAAALERSRQQMLQYHMIGNSYRREARAQRCCRQ